MMWITIWLACGQASVESNDIASKPVEHSAEKTVNKTADKPIVQPSKPLVKGTLFFAKSPDCVSDCIAEVTRMVPEWNPQVALDALYAGPSKKMATYVCWRVNLLVRKSHRLNQDLQV